MGGGPCLGVGSMAKRLLYPTILSVTLSLALAGVVYAATNTFTSLEVESGTRTGNVALAVDATASADSIIKFGESTVASCPVAKRVITSTDVTNRTNSGYPAGTEVYVPGSLDPWGGCFPNAANTGIPAGTTLTNYTGPCTITANTTIDSKNITCSLYINSGTVTIKNSKITAGNIWINGGSLMFTDNEVNFGNNPDDEGLKGNNFTVLRSNLYGGKRQVWCNNTCLIEDSYLHDQLMDPGGETHESAARVEQNTTLRHNTLWCNATPVPPNAGCSANQTGYPDFAPVHSNTMERNLYMATTGGFCSYGGATNGKPYTNDPLNATNIKSIDNVFQRGTSPNDRDTIPLSDKRRYTCGYYGVTRDYNSGKTGFVFTGNRWDDGLLFVNDATYPYGGFY